MTDATTCDRRPSSTDLIIYALVDSLVLHSSYSNIRLESYLFTSEAFADIKKRLAPGGVFVMYNYFRQGWIVARLHSMLEQTFGAGQSARLQPARADRRQAGRRAVQRVHDDAGRRHGTLKEALTRACRGTGCRPTARATMMHAEWVRDVR